MIGHCISVGEWRSGSGGTVDGACKCTAVRGARACAGVGTKTLRPSVDCFTSARALTRSPKVKLTRFIADNNTRVCPYPPVSHTSTPARHPQHLTLSLCLYLVTLRVWRSNYLLVDTYLLTQGMENIVGSDEEVLWQRKTCPLSPRWLPEPHEALG